MLAAAYAEAGDFPKAVETAQITCALAYLTGQYEVQASNGKLLGLYAAGKSIAAFKLAQGGSPGRPGSHQSFTLGNREAGSGGPPTIRR